MKPDTYITIAGLLFGFLFAGFWWALNRELTFEPGQRHFKLGYALLLLSMGILAVFGILAPLAKMSSGDPDLVAPFRATVLAIIGVFGYMLTELGHYSVFQRPKYTTWQEHLFFWGTLIAMAVICAIWFLYG